MKRVLARELDYPGDGLHYLDGEPFTGIAVSVTKDGFERSQLEYRNGLRWGASKEWYAPGVAKVEATHYKGVLHGRAREWHRNGQLAEDGEYEYGIVLWEKQWDEEGTVTKDYRLTQTDRDFETLQRYRTLYQDQPGTTN